MAVSPTLTTDCNGTTASLTPFAINLLDAEYYWTINVTKGILLEGWVNLTQNNNTYTVYSTPTNPNPTTAGDGTWGAILKLTASLSGNKLTLTASKNSGQFAYSGKMYFKVGSYEPSGVNRSSVLVEKGTVSKSFTHDLSTYTGYPKDFYVRFESATGGYAWVGPIRVSQKPVKPIYIQ